MIAMMKRMGVTPIKLLNCAVQILVCNKRHKIRPPVRGSTDTMVTEVMVGCRRPISNCPVKWKVCSHCRLSVRYQCR